MFRRFATVLSAAIVLTACGQQPQQPKMPPPMAGFIIVKTQAVTLTNELPGRTNPTAIAEIRPQVSGIILRRLFTEGSLVKKGQPLYQINPAPYQAVYDSAAAAAASAKSRADRFEALLKAEAIAPQDAADARAAYLQAKAAQDAARINLDFTRITSPITGRIGASTFTEGALVAIGQPTALALVSTLDPIYVDIDQSSSELLAMKRAAQIGQMGASGAKVTLKLDDGSTYPLEGKLQFTDVTVDPSTGVVKLRALFPNPDNLLLPGLYVRATVTEGVDPNGILVPQAAVGHDAKGQPTAMVIDEKNIARLRMLKTGSAKDGNWQVLEGLKAGDKLIVEGLQKVQPDGPVIPAPAGAGKK